MTLRRGRVSLMTTEMFKRYASERSSIGDLVIGDSFLTSTGHLSDSGLSQELITCAVL